MPTDFLPAPAEYLRILPEIILCVAGTLLMVLNPLVRKPSSSIYGTISILAMLAAIAASVYANGIPGAAFSSMLVIDGFATFFRILVISIGVIVVLGSFRFLAREQAEAGEFHALMLFSIVGQCVMVKRERTDHDLHRSGDFVHRDLCSCRLSSRR